MDKNRIFGSMIGLLLLGGVMYFGFFAEKPEPAVINQSISRPAEGVLPSPVAEQDTALDQTDSAPAGSPNQSSAWEPVGKYSNKEIMTASVFIGEMYKHVKKMEAIELRVSKSLRSGYRNTDSSAIVRAVAGYQVDTIEESESIDSLQVPDLLNLQASDFIHEALIALKKSSEIQGERASVLAQFLTPNSDSEAIGARLKDLDVQRNVASMGMVRAFMAYISYGFTSEAIDDKTYRLKANFKPNRELVKQRQIASYQGYAKK